MDIPSTLNPIDIAVILAYVAGVVGFGAWFVRKSSSPEEFMAAGRSLPGWAIGLSIFGTYVSSISFLANPGKSFSANWNPFVFGLALPIAALIATKYFVPFYRKSGEISAYSHLEHRFGAWARTYVVICYLLTQIVRIGAIMLLVAIALKKLTGWDEETIIIATGILVTVYTLLGGIEAVIWTDVVQSIVLTIGALVCVALIVTRMPEGAGQVFTIAAEHDKFSLGGFGPSLASSTFWVILIYGLFENLKNFGIDQSYVQRYIAAKSEADARRSVWIGTLLFVPTSALLFFIGTALFSYYYSQPELMKELVPAGATLDDGTTLAANETDPEVIGQFVSGDDVFPHFIVHELPAGLTGLLIAAIFAAAMSSVDSSLNGSATLILIDVYKRYFRPNAGKRESMVVLYTTTLVWGALGTVIAIALIPVDSVLDAWWKVSAILGGGMLGLFLLGIISQRAGNPAAVTGVVVGILVITWLTLNQMEAKTIDGVKSLSTGLHEWLLSVIDWYEAYSFPIDGVLTLVIGTLVIFFVGICVSLFFGRPPAPRDELPADRSPGD